MRRTMRTTPGSPNGSDDDASVHTSHPRNVRNGGENWRYLFLKALTPMWRHYLMGRHFIILTDQKSLKFLCDQRVLGEEQFKWTSKLMGFDFEIQYKPGQQNRVADALSRRMSYAALSTIQFDELEEWETEIQNDKKLQEIIQDLLKDSHSYPGYSFRDRKLFFKGRLVLPKGSSKIPKLLKEFHDSATGGHSGFFRTYKRISAILHWEGMRKDIQQYVATCEVCQLNKYQTLSHVGLLQPLPIPTQGSTIPSVVEEVNVLTQERDQMLHELKSNLVKAQVQMKTYADQSRRPVTLSTGDWVYLKLQPYRLKSIAKKRNEKLSPRFYGPYQIIKQIGPVAFELDLPPESKIHPVFHVSLLKKALAPTSNQQPLPPMLSEDLELQVSPAAVSAVRNNANGSAEVLIQWQDLPEFEATWEPVKVIEEQFPSFHLKDKVSLLGGSIVRPLMKNTYKRKGH
ncbi:hypothetical protein KIW84_012811 [Lathyrus oleraceus]|uniref:Uncharacterized protein n=1 Tax=Pisum sativum TaxID=3888 RepID=A0A9D5GX50_PEA|nr:hypothetical protein KIW84_012811 [Pisum sativum]